MPSSLRESHNAEVPFRWWGKGADIHRCNCCVTEHSAWWAPTHRPDTSSRPQSTCHLPERMHAWEASPGLCEAMCSSKGQLPSRRGDLITMNIKNLEGMGPGGSSRPPRSQTGSIIRLRQRNLKFQVSLGYIVRPCLRNKKQTREHWCTHKCPGWRGSQKLLTYPG